MVPGLQKVHAHTKRCPIAADRRHVMPHAWWDLIRQDPTVPLEPAKRAIERINPYRPWNETSRQTAR